MTMERWARVRELFALAADLPVGRRLSFLEEEAAGDPELVREVLDLLAAEEEAGSFLERGALEELRRCEELSEPWLGRRFGAYEAVAELGRGGMGIVLLGQRADGRYEGRVAIKVLPRIVQDDVLKRFRAEGQILAALHHENVARLLDAGESDGVSYLIMEHVDGPRIDRYADAQGLAPGVRLRLFRQVLDGVAYAHSRGVIHRDLKPSNILVSKEGRPKIVDFGIAKLLNADMRSGVTEQTRTGHARMTPEYASPEQVRGERVGAASDVYSLGVVLYRLLTGTPPYDLDTTRPSETERVICEQAPRRPSDAAAERESGDALRRELRGDLDTIILKALAKDPAERYASVADFAEDIDRHVDGRAIGARAPSVLYRSRRFATRHRVTLTIALIALMGAASLAWQASVAAIERERARENSEALSVLAESMLGNLARVRAETGQPTEASEMAVTAALESIEDILQSLDGEPDPELLMTLGRAYLTAGAVQGNPFESNLGKTAEAEQSFLSAIDLFGRVANTAPQVQAAIPEQARARVLLSDVLLANGRYAAAATLLEQVHPVFDSIAGASPDGSRNLAGAEAHMRSAMARNGLGDFPVAEGHIEQAIALVDGLPLEDMDEGAVEVSQIRATGFRLQLADLYHWSGRLDESISLAEDAVRFATARVAAGGRQPMAGAQQAEALRQLGWHLLRADRLEEARDVFTRKLDVLSPLTERDSANAQLRLLTGLAYEGRGQASIKGGDWAEALADEREALRLLDVEWLATSGGAAGSATTRRQIGEALTGLGRFTEAEAELALALEQTRAILGAEAETSLASMSLAIAYSSLATLYQIRAGETGSEPVDCPRAAAMTVSADSVATLVREKFGVLPGFEDVWEDFEARKSPEACERYAGG